MNFIAKDNTDNLISTELVGRLGIEIWDVLIIGGGVMASLVAGLAFAIKPLAAKPARVLRARD